MQKNYDCYQITIKVFEIDVFLIIIVIINTKHSKINEHIIILLQTNQLQLLIAFNCLLLVNVYF